MGKINIASWVLGLGAVGQTLMLGNTVKQVPSWLVILPLLGPWLLIYVISLCRVAPCGRRRFAQLLKVAMVWYAADSIVCELVWCLVPSARSHIYSAVIPHLLTYGCAISFIVFLRAVRPAREYLDQQPESA